MIYYKARNSGEVGGWRMALSYKKLWKRLIDCDMTRGDLHHATGVALSTLTKMSKGECVATSVIERICRELQCDVGDIMEVVPEEDTESVP